MRVVQATIAGSRNFLADNQDLDALKEEMERACAAGGAFVDVRLSGDRVISVLISASTSVSFESLDVEEEEFLEDEWTSGSSSAEEYEPDWSDSDDVPKNPLAEIPGTERLEECRDLIEDLVAGSNIPVERATLIHRLYKLPEAGTYTPASLRAEVVKAQEKLADECTNEDDFVSTEPVSEIPAPFLAKLPGPNGASICANVLDLVKFRTLKNPVTREDMDDATVALLAQQVRTILDALQ